MIEDIETVRRSLSKEQRKNLIAKIDSSGLFKVSPLKIFWFIPFGWRVDVKNPKKEHPKSKFFKDYLPVGFIGRDAELVNLFEPFPEDYPSKLKKIYYKTESPEFSLQD